MTTLAVLSRDIEKTLKAAMIEEAALDAMLLISHVLNLTSIDYALDKDRKITEQECVEIMELVQQRVSRIPMAQIFGEKEFWSLSFRVTNETLTPRPDSETLIETALNNVSDKSENIRVLDMGTGTGCLLLSLLSELPNANGLGLDISNAALDVAQCNAENLNLVNRAAFKKSNWTDQLRPDEKFGIIIANPPYIGTREKESLAPEVKDHEPDIALFSGCDGLNDYKIIAEQIGSYLADDGMIILEIGYKQAEDVKNIFTSAGFNDISLHKDLGGRDRCLLIKK